MKELSNKYAALLAERKECYEECKAVQKELFNYQTTKQNVDCILGLGSRCRKAGDRKKLAECGGVSDNIPVTCPIIFMKGSAMHSLFCGADLYIKSKVGHADSRRLAKAGIL